MGANLVPIVRDFSIHVENFPPTDHSVADGCVDPGVHRLLRFDFLSHNKGNADLVVGAPSAHPEWFVESASHGHFHLKDFNEFILFDCEGHQVTKGYKQAFCLIDVEHTSPWGPATAKFTDCNTNQGVSAGWSDLYHKSLPCQFIVIDGVPDGDYTLQSTTNKPRLIPEDTYRDNTIYTGLRIQGNTVVEIPPCYVPLDPYLFQRWAAVVRILFGVVQDGGGVVLPPGGGPIPIDPLGPLRELSPASRDILAGVAISELAELVNDNKFRTETRTAAAKAIARAAEQLGHS